MDRVFQAHRMTSSWRTLAFVWAAALPLVGGSRLAAVGGPAEPSATNRETPAALLSLSDEELARRVEADVTSLGSLSIGSPNAGILVNPVSMPEGPYWQVSPTAELWGTEETIAAVETVLSKVHEVYPDAPPILVGDISDADGGRLKRHLSHQSGRDIDFGFFFKSGQPASLVAGTAANLDLPRNWAFVRALVTETDVEAIFLDTRVQRLLYQYALSISEDKEWLDRVFRFPRGYTGAIISHERGHRNHYHVRFYNPVAQELGRRAHPILVQYGVLPPPVYTVRHVVRPGQTMGHLASRYGTSVRAIKQANGMTSTLLRAGRAYRIPVKTAAPRSEPIAVPPRLLPPTTPVILADAAWATSAPGNAVAGPADPSLVSPAAVVRASLLF